MPESDTRERNESSTGELLAYAYAAVSVVLRLFPVVFNLAPIGALSLFTGSRLRSWKAYVLPVVVMLVSDVGLYWRRGDRPCDPYVYSAFLLNVLLGGIFLRKVTAVRVGGMAVLSSVLFFVITNFGSWVELTTTYERSFAGLFDCYVKGAAFYRPTLCGDLAFSALFFGVYAWAVSAKRAPAAEKAA